MPQPLDYRSPTPAAPPAKAWLAVAALVAVFITANAVLVRLTMWDKSWVSAGCPVYVVPLTNALLSLAALACTRRVQRISPAWDVAWFVGFAVCLPIAGTVAGFVAMLISEFGTPW
jgi:hypothetical protein